MECGCATITGAALDSGLTYSSWPDVPGKAGLPSAEIFESRKDCRPSSPMHGFPGKFSIRPRCLFDERKFRFLAAGRIRGAAAHTCTSLRRRSRHGGVRCPASGNPGKTPPMVDWDDLIRKKHGKAGWSLQEPSIPPRSAPMAHVSPMRLTTHPGWDGTAVTRRQDSLLAFESRRILIRSWPNYTEHASARTNDDSEFQCLLHALPRQDLRLREVC